jgi:hypothetical protein
MEFTSEEMDMVRDAVKCLIGESYDNDYIVELHKLLDKMGRGNMPEEVDLRKWMTETNDIMEDEMSMVVGDMIDRDWYAVAERYTPREFVDELKARIEDGDYSGIWS